MQPRNSELGERYDCAREENFITAFVCKERRSRYLEVVSTPEGWRKFLKALPHNLQRELQAGRFYLIQPSAHKPLQIAELLESWGAPSECYLISQDSEFDRRTMQLRSALEQVVGTGNGNIVYCTPDLAYYEAEDQGMRYLLLRTPHLHPHP